MYFLDFLFPLLDVSSDPTASLCPTFLPSETRVVWRVADQRENFSPYASHDAIAPFLRAANV